MADVTTVIVGPDTTGLVVEDDIASILLQDDETVITSAEIHTVVVFQDSTVVVGSSDAGPQGSPGAPGPPGSSATDTLVTAGEALSAGKLITLTTLGAFYFDGTNISLYGKAVGVTKHAAGAGAQIAIQVSGPVDLVGAGFTPGARFWAGTNGNLVTSSPVAGMVVPVGYAVDADTLMVQIESYLEW